MRAGARLKLLIEKKVYYCYTTNTNTSTSTTTTTNTITITSTIIILIYSKSPPFPSNTHYVSFALRQLFVLLPSDSTTPLRDSLYHKQKNVTKNSKIENKTKNPRFSKIISSSYWLVSHSVERYCDCICAYVFYSFFS